MFYIFWVEDSAHIFIFTFFFCIGSFCNKTKKKKIQFFKSNLNSI